VRFDPALPPSDTWAAAAERFRVAYRACVLELAYSLRIDRLVDWLLRKLVEAVEEASDPNIGGELTTEAYPSN
jgi:hypothetical protein